LLTTAKQRKHSMFAGRRSYFFFSPADKKYCPENSRWLTFLPNYLSQLVSCRSPRIIRRRSQATLNTNVCSVIVCIVLFTCESYSSVRRLNSDAPTGWHRFTASIRFHHLPLFESAFFASTTFGAAFLFLRRSNDDARTITCDVVKVRQSTQYAFLFSHQFTRTSIHKKKSRAQIQRQLFFGKRQSFFRRRTVNC
jgi:hypothetical protein